MEIYSDMNLDREITLKTKKFRKNHRDTRPRKNTKIENIRPSSFGNYLSHIMALKMKEKKDNIISPYQIVTHGR